MNKGGVFLGDTPHPEDVPLHRTATSHVSGLLVPLRVTLWNTLTDPESSLTAAVIAGIGLSAIVVSISTLCIETFLSVARDRRTMFIMEYIEFACVIIFTIEYFCMLWAAPNRYRFVVNILNIFDFVSVLPWYINLGICRSIFACTEHRIHFAGVRFLLEHFGLYAVGFIVIFVPQASPVDCLCTFVRLRVHHSQRLSLHHENSQHL